jgi:hypothetical protein
MRKELITELAAHMQSLAKAEQEMQARREAFDEANASLVDSIGFIKQQIETVKTEIKPEALAEFEATGNKKLVGGIGIRETSFIEYDESQAFKFAKEKDMFLQLDKKAFDKAAGSLALDFVKTGRRPSVTFPKEVKLDA